MQKSVRIFNLIFLSLCFGLTACTGNSDTAKITISDTCSLDNILGATGGPSVFTALVNSDVEFQGWVADIAIANSAKKVKIELLNLKNQVQFVETGVVGIKRVDVAAAFKAPTLENAGFFAKSKLQGISSGEYEILLIASYDNQITVCRTHKNILVK